MSADADRLSAALLGRYRIERELGAGGMATVYLAHDIKHDRDVAIKVLKPELAAVLGAERFVVEIRTTAAMQHPHILPLFDSGEADGFLYYVMPFIDGETIREKLNRETQFGIDEAVRITREVADALDYAHRRGVIHRDIKPENILLHDGRAMVMDFGIALAVSAAAGGRMTETGLSLGTPHYMSPEQATAEKEVTARADIYSLASVLYEMLAGNPPHTGASAQQVIMKIIVEQPAPVTTLRKSVPNNVAAALTTALEKLPADRFGSAGDFASALMNVHYRGAQRVGVARPASLRANRPAMTLAGIAALMTVAAAWSLLPSRASVEAEPVSRLAIVLPDSESLSASAGRRVAFSPDGSEYVYVGEGKGGSQLWRRAIGSLSATPIPGSSGATNPSYSPDGQNIAFLTFGPFSVRTIPRMGGLAQTIVSKDVSGGGVDWNPDGFIYFDGGTSLDRVRADGSQRESMYTFDSTEAVAWPTALPGGKGVLVRSRKLGMSARDYSIDVIDLEKRTRKHLLAAVVATFSPRGFLLYVTADGSLHAQRFDPKRLELSGKEVLLWTGASVGTFGAADVVTAHSGDVLYVAGPLTDTHRRVVWVDRNGAITQVDDPPVDGLITSLALSPDATRIALGIAGNTKGEAIWVKRLGGGPMSQVSRGAELNWAPTWSPDGRDLLYLSDRDSVLLMMRQAADGSSAATPVLGGLDMSAEFNLARDGRVMVLRLNRTRGNGDFFLFHPGLDAAPTPLMGGPALERSPAISPDGHWLAYASDESGGSSEVYVRPFPSTDSARIQVSTAGGSIPRWSHSGKELFFTTATSMMSAKVKTGLTMSFENPSPLFSLAPFWQWSNSGRRWYDIAPDDRRFVMITALGTSNDRDNLVYVSRLFDDLERRLPR